MSKVHPRDVAEISGCISGTCDCTDGGHGLLSPSLNPHDTTFTISHICPIDSIYNTRRVIKILVRGRTTKRRAPNTCAISRLRNTRGRDKETSRVHLG